MKNVIQGTTLTGTGAVHVAPGAEITIRNPAGQLVPLWADRAGTQPHDNPFLTDNEGNFRVYADSGWVHVRAQKDGSVREWRYVPIGSAAAMDIGEVYEALGAEVYSSVEGGLSESAEGDYFLVESSGSLDLYRVVNGVAEQRELGIEADAILATRAYADGVAAEAESNATNAAVAAASSAYQQATEYSDSQLQTHRESGDHDHRYYTKTEIDQALDDKVDEGDPRLSDARDWIAPMVTQAEVEGGESTEPRKWSVEMVKLAAETFGGGGSGGVSADDVSVSGLSAPFDSAENVQAALALLGSAAGRDVTTGVNDLTAGRLATIEQVRRHIGTPGAVYTQRVVLLHPVYDGGALLPLHIVDGAISAFRGGTNSLNFAEKVYVVSSSSYNNNNIRLFSVESGPSITWEPVTCLYGGTKYIALKMPYVVQGYGSGVYFEGRIYSQSSDPNILKIVDYYDVQAQTVLNAEIYNSITPAPAADHFRIGNSIAYHTGNVAKLRSDLNLVDPLGVGQTWQDVTLIREAGTTYTNNSGRPIMVAISLAGYEGYTFIVDGVEVAYGSSANDVQSHNVWAIVPSGSTYRLITLGVIYRWAELR